MPMFSLAIKKIDFYSVKQVCLSLMLSAAIWYSLCLIEVYFLHSYTAFSIESNREKKKVCWSKQLNCFNVFVSKITSKNYFEPIHCTVECIVNVGMDFHRFISHFCGLFADNQLWLFADIFWEILNYLTKWKFKRKKKLKYAHSFKIRSFFFGTNA